MVNIGVPQGYGIAVGPTVEASTPGSTIPGIGVRDRSRNASTGGFIVPPLPLTGDAFLRLPTPSLGYGNPIASVITPPATGVPFHKDSPPRVTINKSGPRGASLVGDVVNATPLGTIGSTRDALANARTRPLVPVGTRDAIAERMPEAVRARVATLARRAARLRSARPTTARVGRE